jgi:hypothetical protein
MLHRWFGFFMSSLFAETARADRAEEELERLRKEEEQYQEELDDEIEMDALHYADDVSDD